jgi:DNA-binding transcriptional regulator YiaG
MGVSELMVCRWEKNRCEPGTRYFPKIIKFLGYTPYRTPYSFGEWFRQCRQSYGMSQATLAVKLGIDETTVAKWERDEHQPVERSLRIVKEYFGSLPRLNDS